MESTTIRARVASMPAPRKNKGCRRKPRRVVCLGHGVCGGVVGMVGARRTLVAVVLPWPVWAASRASCSIASSSACGRRTRDARFTGSTGLLAAVVYSSTVIASAVVGRYRNVLRGSPPSVFSRVGMGLPLSCCWSVRCVLVIDRHPECAKGRRILGALGGALLI